MSNTNITTNLTSEKQDAGGSKREPKADLQDAALVLTQMFREELAYDEERETWLLWQGTHWKRDDRIQVELDRRAVEAMREVGVSISSGGQATAVTRFAKIGLRREFVTPEGLINFVNGTLDLVSNTLREHRQGDGLDYCLPYAYEPNGSYPIINTYLKSAIPDPFGREAVKAHIGRGLMRDMSLAHILVLKGVKRAGKSLLMMLATAIAGGRIISGNTEELRQWAGPSIFSQDTEGKRARAIWRDKLIVCADEVNSDAFRNEESIKNMSAHSGVEARRIGKDEETNNTWKPVIFIATNDTPSYKDVSGALRERLVPIYFPKRLRESERDLMLMSKMYPEIGAFAAECIAAAQRALKIGRYRRSKSMMAILDEWAELTDPVKAVINQHCVRDPKGRLSVKRLHLLLEGYCKETGKQTPAAQEMTKRILDMEMGVRRGSVRDEEFSKNPIDGYFGLRLRTNNDGLAKAAFVYGDWSEYIDETPVYAQNSDESTEAEDLVKEIMSILSKEQHQWCVDRLEALEIDMVKGWLNETIRVEGKPDGRIPTDILNAVIIRF